MVWKICFEPSQTFALQVSELSERQSVGSFEISSSSEDDLEEDDEQDQEYTIYSVLPNRQLEVVSKLPAKSKTSSYRPPGPRGLEDANVRSKGPPGKTQSQTGGEVSIKSAPQSCTVHEGKILTLTCIVAGPKYTGIEGNTSLLFFQNPFQTFVGSTARPDSPPPPATGCTNAAPRTTSPSSTSTPAPPGSTVCAPSTTRRRRGAGSR